ncbi:hypothetical protein [Paraburkholderia sp. RL17-337-BIB-A]|uniref:hypothetical protein n=1 Tax=Paraburkholderia sp. RL17-337-BIB-A TaxID=3031636 RepID=UPI0038B94E56
MLSGEWQSAGRAALKLHISLEANVLATKPCIATCVIDGVAVTLTFFPDTGFLRIADVTGVRSRETRWSAPWRSLVTTFRELSETPEDERADPDMLSGCQNCGSERLEESMATFS